MILGRFWLYLGCELDVNWEYGVPAIFSNMIRLLNPQRRGVEVELRTVGSEVGRARGAGADGILQKPF